MERKNAIEYKVYGKYALFTDPLTKTGGEKLSYQVPTYQALKGITESIYWKPTFTWVIDECRVMHPIRTESKGMRPIKYQGGNDLASYTYLKDIEYRVKAHFVWNENRPDLVNDRNENKHYQIAKRMLERGGRRDIFLGTRECQAFVEPCEFGSGAGYYDDMEKDIDFGFSYHGITYAEEAVLSEDQGKMTVRFWEHPTMTRGGYIVYPRPEECTIKRHIRKMQPKIFENIEKEEHEKREVKDT